MKDTNITYKEFIYWCTRWGYDEEEGYKALSFARSIIDQNFKNYTDCMVETQNIEIHPEIYRDIVTKRYNKARMLYMLYVDFHDNIRDMTKKHHDEVKKMNDNKTKKICGIAALTALYCVLGAFMKFTLIGNIQVDLGYIALAVGCSMFGPWAAFIGAVGCGIESILFSAYGFSISWFIGNLIIGLGCGFVFKKTSNNLHRLISIIVFVALGILLAKTIIECYLYTIPFEVKIIKNAVAFAVDSAVMCATVLFGRLSNTTSDITE